MRHSRKGSYAGLHKFLIIFEQIFSYILLNIVHLAEWRFCPKRKAFSIGGGVKLFVFVKVG
jgi:hypothetical protein